MCYCWNVFFCKVSASSIIYVEYQVFIYLLCLNRSHIIDECSVQLFSKCLFHVKSFLISNSFGVHRFREILFQTTRKHGEQRGKRTILLYAIEAADKPLQLNSTIKNIYMNFELWQERLQVAAYMHHLFNDMLPSYSFIVHTSYAMFI